MKTNELKTRKLSVTVQRQVILKKLSGVKTHPTAMELYTMVREEIPKISLGTVYRNLDILAEKQLIRRLELDGGQRRFDADTSDHHHVCCTNCGRVDDVPQHLVKSMKTSDLPNTIRGYRITGYTFNFYGICKDCRRKISEKKRTSIN